MGEISSQTYYQRFNQSEPIDKSFKTFEKQNKWGVKDQQGRVIIKPKYDLLAFVRSGIIYAKLQGKKGLIDLNEKIVIPFGKYNEIYSFQNGRAIVKKNKLSGVIDQNAKEIVPCIYKSADYFRFNLCNVTNIHNKQGIIDISGAVVVPIIYDKLIDMWDVGMLKAKKNGKWGCIDYHNEELIEFNYDFITRPSNEMIAVKQKNKFGLYNIYGIQVFPCVYDTIYSFSNGKAAVIKEGKWGYILLNGTEKIFDIKAKKHIK
ncbi:MAG: WG repeat-containing protein [Bacteroidota bacterium]|nr:WG repeat-containing protein [Bacteroidota bacterium]